MWLGFLQSVVFDFSIFRMEHPPELGNLSEVFFDGSIGKSKVAHDAASQVVRHHEVNLKLTEQDHFFKSATITPSVSKCLLDNNWSFPDGARKSVMFCLMCRLVKPTLRRINWDDDC